MGDKKSILDTRHKLSDCTFPEFDRKKVKENTYNAPTWLHFGAGNIFRGFPAVLQQQLLNSGKVEQGIIVCEGYDEEIIERVYKPYDDISLLVVLKADGSINKKVIGSVTESLVADCEKEDWSRLQQIFSQPSLQMVSFTITEKGYSLVNGKGDYLADVQNDLQKGPNHPKSFIGKVAALCYTRYQQGGLPLALVSMDNCSHNGIKLQRAVSTFATIWQEQGLVENGFKAYIENPQHIAFPCSMIDKITPRPDEKIKKLLEEDGFKDMNIICTHKNTYIAPFVNAEESQYLVIEDIFPNGRPPLEEVGVIFTSQSVVDQIEKMKVCTCLNPLHTALAIYGCLLSYDFIYEEMKDEELKKLVEKIGYEEGLPVVVDPKIISPEAFIKEVLEVRLPNTFIPDKPQRIATDTSQKLAIRFGETIKAYEARKDLNPKDLKYIPLVLAGWCRYLLGVNDNGEAFELSPDPMLEQLKEYVKGISLGNIEGIHGFLQPLLSNEKIFGINLYEVGLGNKIEGYFIELIKGKGAVRATLQKYL